MPASPVPLPPASDRTPLSPADVKAAFARAWSDASSEPPDIEQAPVPTPPGFVAWRIVGTRGVTVLPQLKPHPPITVWRGYFARVLSNLVGRCPLCGSAASINADPEHSPAAWASLDITVGVEHATGCAAVFDDWHRQYFDERSVPR